jgi:hypothetical protein
MDLVGRIHCGRKLKIEARRLGELKIEAITPFKKKNGCFLRWWGSVTNGLWCVMTNS